MYVLYDTLLSSTCDNNIFQSQNARRTSLTVMPRAKMVYSQTSSLPESQVNRGCDVRMQAATFESFSMVAILPRIQMGKQGSIEIARYARTPPHYFMLRIQRMQLILPEKRPRRPLRTLTKRLRTRLMAICETYLQNEQFLTQTMYSVRQL